MKGHLKLESEKTVMLFDMKRKIEDIHIDKDEKWAIYGTGNGAEWAYTEFRSLFLLDNIKCVIDRDDQVYPNRKFHGIPVKKLTEAEDFLDGILIAAMDNHRIIKERVINNLKKSRLRHIRIIDIFCYNTQEEKEHYVEYIEQCILRKSTEFVDIKKVGYQRKEGDTKVIAWYLPQFHQIDINNDFHGKGFTEWTNTSKALPLFTGHYQPHIPYDVGYYNLLNVDTWKRQIFLAKHYGIYGFCIHYYWFSGIKLMEKPLEFLLDHKELDIPFCFNWANENWTALWDGGNREIMLEQKLKEKDGKKFMEDILPYMKDARYIKIDEKPVLLIYRISTFEHERAKKLLHEMRTFAKNVGFPDLYIILADTQVCKGNVDEWGADALVEYQPHKILELMNEYKLNGYLNPYFNGKIYDSTSFIAQKRYMRNHDGQVYFRSALTSWDNTARKALSNAIVLSGLDPSTFKIWLKDIIDESQKIHSDPENIVFVNSWNEWAEGSHLEPDLKYGYAFLQSVKEAIEESRHV